MESLSVNARAILETKASIEKREEYVRRLKKIEHEIDSQERQVRERQNEVADRGEVVESLRNAGNAVKSNLQEHDRWRLNLLRSLETAHRNLCGPQDTQISIQKEGATVLAILQESLKVVLDDERTLLEQAIHSLARLEMRSQEKLKQDASKNPLGEDRSGGLTEERTSLVSLIEELAEGEDRLRTLRRQRQELLQQVRECRSQQYRLRKERAHDISESLKKRLRVQVDFKGHKAGYKERLSLLLKDANLSPDSIDRLAAPEGTDGIVLAEAVRRGSKEVQTSFGLDPGMAEHLVQWLTVEESRLFELETSIPRDTLRLGPRIDGRYRAMEDLSAGQKAAAVLLFLFGTESRILVIDQPEDYLEDRSTRKEMLHLLMEQRKSENQNLLRQTIFATNDATIPAGNGAESVIPLEVREGRVHVMEQASIKEGEEAS